MYSYLVVGTAIGATIWLYLFRNKYIVFNFIQMPSLLKCLSLLGISIPLISIIVLTDFQDTEITYQVKSDGNIIFNGYYAIGLVLTSVPIFFASILMMKKSELSRWCYVLGLITISIPSLYLSLIHDSNTESIYSNIEWFMISLLHDLVIIIGVWFYLFKNKNVASYFSHNK